MAAPCELPCTHAEDNACARGSRVHVAAHRCMRTFERTGIRTNNGLTNESLPS